MKKIDLDRLKAIAAEDNEEPSVTTLDPQIRTSKYAPFAVPKDAVLADEESETL
ncbi:hypothetical protein ACPC54_33955 [Kitasatospora sp. NPDC094028]